MIRREIQLADGGTQWLLISQVEHARLSGLLAEKCLDQFGRPNNSLDAMRQELLQAIIHHDDGWAAWEEKPRLDPQLGRPLSFMEVEPADALTIWNRSIQAAREFGELAGWAVAGHFSALLATVGSEQSKNTAGQQWLRDTAARRSQWFASWHGRNESLHTAELAGEALKWVQLFDILSLWPCSRYPVQGELAAEVPEPFRTTQGILVHEIRPGREQGEIVFDPWPFREERFVLQAAGQVAPVRHYRDSAELLAARVPFVAEWVLTRPT
jgi:hypothetical protein